MKKNTKDFVSLAAGLANAFGDLAASESAFCASWAALLLERPSLVAWGRSRLFLTEIFIFQPRGKVGPAARSWGPVLWAVLAALISTREILIGGDTNTNTTHGDGRWSGTAGLQVTAVSCHQV